MLTRAKTILGTILERPQLAIIALRGVAVQRIDGGWPRCAILVKGHGHAVGNSLQLERLQKQRKKEIRKNDE
jgi:hypothetical protein